MSRYLAIGSVCWDVVDGDDAPRLGGSVLFAGQVALAAGWDVEVITSGTAQLEDAVRAALPGVEVTVQRSAHDTVMAFGADADLGPQKVPTVADPIDLVRLGRRADADVVHLAPIMGEVTPELLTQLGGAGFVGITPQGLLRVREAFSHRLRLLEAPEVWWAGHTDAIVVSESEHARLADEALASGRAVAVTRGERGCCGWRGAERVDLPGVELASVSPTGTIGAGDVFAAALFLGLAGGSSFADAMDAANQRAAAHVGGTA